MTFLLLRDWRKGAKTLFPNTILAMYAAMTKRTAAVAALLEVFPDDLHRLLLSRRSRRARARLAADVLDETLEIVFVLSHGLLYGFHKRVIISHSQTSRCKIFKSGVR
jgi:hypothetical protein